MLLSTSETDEEEVNPPPIIINQDYENNNNNIIKNYEGIVLKKNLLKNFLCECYDKENLISSDNNYYNDIDHIDISTCCCNCSNNKIINNNNSSSTAHSIINESADKIRKLSLYQELKEIIINSKNNNNNKNYTIKTYESSSSPASARDLFSPIKKKKNLKTNSKNKKHYRQHRSSIIYNKEKTNENIFEFNVINKCSKQKKTLIRNNSNNNNNNNHRKSSIITRTSSNYSNKKLIVKEKTIETEIIELTNTQHLNLSKRYKNNLIKKINSKKNSNNNNTTNFNIPTKTKVKKIDFIENKKPKLNKNKLQLKKIKNNLNLLNAIEQKTLKENLKENINNINNAVIDLNNENNPKNLYNNENEKNKSLNQNTDNNLSVRKQFYKLSLSGNQQQNINKSGNFVEQPTRTPKRKSGVLAQKHQENLTESYCDFAINQYNNINSTVKKRTRIDNIINNITTNDMSVYDYRLTTTQSGDQTGSNSSNNNVNINNNYKTYNQISLLERTTLNDNINNHHNINNNILASSNHNNHYLSQAHIVGNPSIATLCNIGNTCYLNSVVYTLRFAPLFLHNLHHLIDDIIQVNQKIGHNKTKSSSLGRNIGGLQGPSTRSWSSKDLASLGNNVNDVPKSNRQIATEKLHELYQNLHRNEFVDNTDPFHADTFLHAIQDVSSIFQGNQQQDAHEFLMCILDSIRETCLSLTKVIYDYPDIVINGYVSLPEQNELQLQNDKQIQPVQPQQQSILPLKKAFFFSRKSKRKDEKIKNVNKPESPLKDNQIITDLTVQDTMSGTVVSNVNSQTLLNDDVIDGSGNNIINDEKQNICSIDKDKINEKIKKLGLNFFTEDFEGITVSTTKCLSCETITEQKETMIDISIPISGQENKDALEKPHLFFQNSCITKEYFSGDNKYRCEQCFGYTEAIRSISFEVLPRLLVIQLKRFSGGMEKINSYIPTPFTLDCFCRKCCTLQENEIRPHVYKLYSVITHVGATMSVGHYIAYTCSLDFYTEYINCPKDERKNSLNASSAAAASNISNSLINNINGTNDNKNQGIMKKKIFRRSKTSSSSDVTKNLKNLNNIISGGNSNKNLINGGNIMNTDNNKNSNANLLTCQGLNCCGIHMKTASNSLINNLYNSSVVGNNDVNEHIAGTYIGGGNTILTTSMSTGTGNSGTGLTNNYSITNDIVNHHQTSSSSSSSTSTATNASTTSRTIINNSEQIWYMCDDDKIKIMTQHEFEDLLSPNRKIMITPYLLFYARVDV